MIWHDKKYGYVTTSREGDSTRAGPYAPGAEPVFILRAQDVASGPTLAAYRITCVTVGAADEHVTASDDIMDTFRQWQATHPMKVPD
jgi:hypothetical protein